MLAEAGGGLLQKGCPKAPKSLRNHYTVEKMETMKSYVEALDQSESGIVKIVKKPLEGLQNAKINFFNHVSSFSDVLQV